MKNSKIAVLILGFAIAGFRDDARAQNEPTPAPPLPSKPAEKPINEQTTAEAWAAFRAGDNKTAIAKADQCINRFRDAADRIQSILEAEKADLPKGAVSATDKKRIAKYQILNDVATCFLIKGWAEEKLALKKEARTAYTEAQKYTYARTDDSTNESFWSPAEKASEHLINLSKTSSE